MLINKELWMADSLNYMCAGWGIGVIKGSPSPNGLCLNAIKGFLAHLFRGGGGLLKIII